MFRTRDGVNSGMEEQKLVSGAGFDAWATFGLP